MSLRMKEKMLENGNNFQEFTNFLGSEKLRISNKLKIVSDLKGEKRTVFYSNSSLKFEIKAKQFYAASQRVL